jgi:hypothetical protein
MGRFVIVVLVAAVLGGLAALGLIDALAEDHSLQIGGVTVPIQVEEGIYDLEQLRIAVAAAAVVAALAAGGLSRLLPPPAAKRRR